MARIDKAIDDHTIEGSIDLGVLQNGRFRPIVGLGDHEPVLGSRQVRVGLGNLAPLSVSLACGLNSRLRQLHPRRRRFELVQNLFTHLLVHNLVGNQLIHARIPTSIDHTVPAAFFNAALDSLTIDLAESRLAGNLQDLVGLNDLDPGLLDERFLAFQSLVIFGNCAKPRERPPCERGRRSPRSLFQRSR